jgi:hypothetical protein
LPASAWVKGLYDHDPQTRLQAQRSLVLLGDAGVPHVEKAYRTGDLTGRMAAGSVLVLLVKHPRSEPALDALVRAAKSPDNLTRIRAVLDLGACGPDAAGALFVLAAICGGDPELGIRNAARKSIVEIRGRGLDQP